MPDAAALSRFVRNRRTVLGLTQEQAAEAAQVGVTTWRMMEKGERESFRALTLARAARALHVAPEELERLASGEDATALEDREGGSVDSRQALRLGARIAALPPEDALLVEALVDRLHDRR